MSPSQIVDYEAGVKRGTTRACLIPRVVTLACFALEHIEKAVTET